MTGNCFKYIVLICIGCYCSAHDCSSDFHQIRFMNLEFEFYFCLLSDYLSLSVFPSTCFYLPFQFAHKKAEWKHWKFKNISNYLKKRFFKKPFFSPLNFQNLTKNQRLEKKLKNWKQICMSEICFFLFSLPLIPFRGARLG